MIVKNKVLTWDIDKAENDGYLSAGSFPLSLGNEKEFEKIKKNKEALLFVFENDGERKGIFCKSRDKYPGELYSIIEQSSKHGLKFKELQLKYNLLMISKYFSFSNLFGRMLNISKIEKGHLIVRKGVKIELYKTNIQFVYFLKFVDKNLKGWRKYQLKAETESEILKKEEIELGKLKGKSLVELRKRIKTRETKKITFSVERFNRDPLIVAYALSKAKGMCELCEKEGPFIKENGEIYLEVHHIIPLSKEGEDLPENVLAVCPNCHRELHCGQDKENLISKFL